MKTRASVAGCSYEGRRVVVTGAASGMGEATARLVAERGGEVWAVDVREPAVHVAKTLLTDLRDEHAIDATAATIEAPIDAVFSCAGLAQTAPCIASVAAFRWPQHQEPLADLMTVTR